MNAVAIRRLFPLVACWLAFVPLFFSGAPARADDLFDSFNKPRRQAAPPDREKMEKGLELIEGIQAFRLDRFEAAVRNEALDRDRLGDAIRDVDNTALQGEALRRLTEIIEGDAPVAVKIRAVYAFGRISKGNPTIQTMVSLINHENEDLRREANEAVVFIARAGDSRVLKALARVLDWNRWDSSELRQAVIPLFRKTQSEPPELERALVAAIKHEEYTVRLAAIEALAAVPIGFDTTWPAVVEAMRAADRSDHPVIKLTAASILLRQENHRPSAVKVLEALLEHEREEVRYLTLFALRDCGEHAKELAPKVIERLRNDQESSVRAQAAYALPALQADAAIVAPALGQAVGDADEEVRKDALYALRQLGSEAAPAAAEIAAALRDRESSVRGIAQFTILEIGCKADTKSRLIFIDALASFDSVPEGDDPTDWMHAIEKIAWSTNDAEVRSRAVAALASCLDHANHDIRRRALWGIVVLRPESDSLVPRFVAIAENEHNNEEMRGETIICLMKFGRAATPALPMLIAMAEGENPALRESALRALSEFDETASAALPVLRRVMENEAMQIEARMSAALAIARIDPDDLRALEFYAKHLTRDIAGLLDRHMNVLVQLSPRSRAVAPRIISLLPSEQNQAAEPGSTADRIHNMAAYGLGEILADAVADDTAEQAAKALELRLQSETAVNRYVAAKALGIIGPAAKSALPLLQKIARDDDEEGTVRVAAAYAVWRLGQPAEEPVKILGTVLQREYEDRLPKLFALQTLKSFGPEAAAAVPAILREFKNSESVARRADAALALAAIGPPAAEAVPALEAALDDLFHLDELSVAAALWKIDGRREQAMPILLAGLKNEESGVRRQAIDALAIIGPEAKAAFPAVAAIVESRDELNVRRQAMLALKAIDPQAALPVLRARFMDDDFYVSRYAKQLAAQMERGEKE